MLPRPRCLSQPGSYRRNKRPTMPVAIVPARLLDDRAEPARLDAWLNLSQREKARELVIVRTRAIAAVCRQRDAPLHRIPAQVRKEEPSAALPETAGSTTKGTGPTHQPAAAI